MENQKKKGIFYYLFLLVLIMIVIYLYRVYQTKNYNQFNLMEYMPYVSTFTRDSKVKYSRNASYKIESNQFNDAMYVKKINVKENTQQLVHKYV